MNSRDKTSCFTGNFIELLEYTRKLYALSGKLNLYIFLCCQEEKPDFIRIREEINCMKKMISNIEEAIES